MAGYDDEAEAWREWLLRAVAGDPRDLRIMYGIRGERRIPEIPVEWLPGYEESLPVRVGNDASSQFQLDVYGEVLDLLHQAAREGLPHESAAWEMELRIMDVLESNWREPDEGIWEVRGGRQQFVHSKVMAWVGVDRAIRVGRAVRVRRPGRPLARAPRRDPRRDLPRGLRRRPR